MKSDTCYVLYKVYIQNFRSVLIKRHYVLTRNVYLRVAVTMPIED